MAPGGKRRKAPKKPRFNHGIPDPFENPALLEGGENWTDHYSHATRLSYDCQGCGKTYATLHHLTSHERVCFSNKRHLSNLLQESKVFWEARKKRRLGEAQSGEESSSSRDLVRRNR
jgi:hypothetical protein